MNKTILKRISLVFLGLMPIGIIIGFSNTWTTFASISIGGSSAVEPLSSALGNAYVDADISVVAGGSGAGIKFAATLGKDIGNASTNPYQKVQDATIITDLWDKETWKKNEMKTVTIAWDAIAIVYKPPSGYTNELVISNNNILTLYDIFAGVKHFPFHSLVPQNLPISNVNFTPYARTGGASASGTATSFQTESSFKNSKNISKDTNDRLKSGNYGNITTQTSESNVESWNRIKSDGKVGSIIYLSLGFVAKNIAEINKSGFKVALYQNENNLDKPSNPIGTTPNDSLTKQTYAWFSPLNSMFSLKFSSEAVKEFMWWIFSDIKAERIISEYGFIPLNIDYKNTMLLEDPNNPSDQIQSVNGSPVYGAGVKNNFLVSNDQALLEKRSAEDKLWYGAPK